MIKTGRNDPCHCGSGKKYKKCCLERDEHREKMQSENSGPLDLITYEEVNAMETKEIVSRLEAMNVPFDEAEFLEDIETYYSADAISEKWFKLYPINALGRDEDYPWFAATILWERLAPQGHLSLEQLFDLHTEGADLIEAGNVTAGCDKWLAFWEGIKRRNNSAYQDLDYLDEQYEGGFLVSGICQDLELELHNAGNKNSIYYEKRIKYCREFCELFPNQEENMLRNMRVAIGESYWKLANYKQAETEFKTMIDDFPESPWGYISWGDMYLFYETSGYDKAKELYIKAEQIAKDEDDIEVVDERLEIIEKKL